MSKVQFIRAPKGGQLAVLPRTEYEALVRAADREDRAQLRAVERRMKQTREQAIPFAAVEAALDGQPLVRAWRAWRGMTAAELATAAGISAGYLSQIETGKRTGTLRVLRAIAGVLEIELADLTGESFA
ncbi:MAG: helix-turn-helix transcriptional regulator [Proteobacteria bacterium]|nr:helix-turn-helix transcriptional regulator [Pseudomonadota bacterium]